MSAHDYASRGLETLTVLTILYDLLDNDFRNDFCVGTFLAKKTPEVTEECLCADGRHHESSIMRSWDHEA